MERFDIGEDDRLARMVAAAERGEEVEIVRGDAVVARLTSTRSLDLRRKVEALRASLPEAARRIDWSAALRETREET